MKHKWRCNLCQKMLSNKQMVEKHIAKIHPEAGNGKHYLRLEVVSEESKTGKLSKKPAYASFDKLQNIFSQESLCEKLDLYGKNSVGTSSTNQLLKTSLELDCSDSSPLENSPTSFSDHQNSPAHSPLSDHSWLDEVLSETVQGVEANDLSLGFSSETVSHFASQNIPNSDNESIVTDPGQSRLGDTGPLISQNTYCKELVQTDSLCSGDVVSIRNQSGIDNAESSVANRRFIRYKNISNVGLESRTMNNNYTKHPIRRDVFKPPFKTRGSCGCVNCSTEPCGACFYCTHKEAK